VLFVSVYSKYTMALTFENLFLRFFLFVSVYSKYTMALTYENLYRFHFSKVLYINDVCLLFSNCILCSKYTSLTFENFCPVDELLLLLLLFYYFNFSVRWTP